MTPQPQDISVAVLAGGLGTRLRSVLPDQPKVLAPVCGRPFVLFILDQLAAAGFRDVVLCTGYRADQVAAVCGRRHGPMTLAYSRETAPLGTAGALRLALPRLRSATILVVNGDSFVDSDPGAFVTWYGGQNLAAGMLLVAVTQAGRYGRVVLDADQGILAFQEKNADFLGPAWINAGLSLLPRDRLAALPADRVLSLEQDLYPRLAAERQLAGFPCQAPFIDIGVPETFAQAEAFFGRDGGTGRRDAG